jgi:hypothetical protein
MPAEASNQINRNPFQIITEVQYGSEIFPGTAQNE